MDGFSFRMDRFGRWFGVISLVICVGMPMGCRSTRSSVSRVPGMGWLSSSEDVQFDGADPLIAGPTKPADEATPELASRQGTSKPRAPYQASSAPDRDEYAASSSSSSAGETGTGDYPDTGYPSPYDAAGSETSRGFYGRGDASEDRYAASDDNYQSPVDDYESAPATEGGYEDDYESYVASDYDASGYGAPSSDNEGRYGTGSESADDYVSAYEDDLRSPVDDLADRVSDARNEFNGVAAAARDRYEDVVTSDADSSFEDARTDLINQAAEEVDRYRNQADQYLAPREGRPGISDTASGLVNNVRDQVQGVAEGVQDRVRGGVDRISEATQDLANGAGTLARDGVNGINRGAQDLGGEVRDDVRDQMDRFDSGARGAADQLSQNATDAYDEAYQAADDLTEDALDAVQGGYDTVRDYAADRVDDLLPPAETERQPAQTAPRTDTPWRPGGTRDYRSPQSGSRGGLGVQPASFPSEPSGSRITPYQQ